MFISLLKMDETDNWFIKECPHKDKVKTIWSVYAFDPNWRVHICSFTATYELHMLPCQIEFHDGTSEEEREEIEDWFRMNEDWSESVTYMNCYDVDKAMSFKEGWFPTMSMGVCRSRNSPLVSISTPTIKRSVINKSNGTIGASKRLSNTVNRTPFSLSAEVSY